jgi:hypothetical protein
MCPASEVMSAIRKLPNEAADYGLRAPDWLKESAA